MPELIPPSTSLIPPQGELRLRLAVALREVDILRRLIRVAEHATRFGRPAEAMTAERQGVTSAG